jgi:hypothetical protein
MEMKSETLKEYRKYLGSGVLGGRFHVGRPHGAQVQTRELELRDKETSGPGIVAVLFDGVVALRQSSVAHHQTSNGDGW